MRLENIFNRLLDAKIDHLVTVVSQDDVNQILANVVNVTFDSSEHHRAFRGGAAFLLHEWFEETNGRLHRFGRLQYKRQLHLPAAKKIAHHLHTFEQNIVDDVECWITFERSS